MANRNALIKRQNENILWATKIRATETPPQSVRYSIQLMVRDPFERPLPPLRRMSGERSAFNV